MINAVSVRKARKLFCTSFGNALLLNPFGMKSVTGCKKGLAFLTKNSPFCPARPRERYYKPAFPSCTFNCEVSHLFLQTNRP